MAPNENISALADAEIIVVCLAVSIRSSGAMYASCDSIPAAEICKNFAMPRSASTNFNCLVNRMFSGLMHKCAHSFSCKNYKLSQTSWITCLNSCSDTFERRKQRRFSKQCSVYSDINYIHNESNALKLYREVNLSIFSPDIVNS